MAPWLQTIVVIVLVAIAAAWLAQRGWKAVTSKGCESGCGGCGGKKAKRPQTGKPAAAATAFIPLEMLTRKKH